MVSAEDVQAAYRFILGRDPENKEVILSYQNISSIGELRTILINSKEFRTHGNLQDRCKPLDWPSMSIELDATPRQMSRMLRHIETYWRDIDQPEVHWSLLPGDSFWSSEFTPNEASFYGGGAEIIKILQETAGRCGISLDQYQRCLELGCGVGRLTVWLAGLFPKVNAVDISRTRIRLNQRALTKFNRHNVEHLHIDNFSGFEAIADFDFLFSLIVLQHNPPPIIVMLVNLLLSKLGPGGAAYFQVPTHICDYSFGVEKYLSLSTREMEMHAIPQHVLFDVIYRNDCQILECREDPWTESNSIISNSLLVRKSGRIARRDRARRRS